MSDPTTWQPDTESDAMLLQHALPGGETEWLLFRHPRRLLAAKTLAAVRPLLRSVEEHTRHGGWAAGFVTYEAAPAFDPAFVTHPPHDTLSLASFGLYGPPKRFPCLPGISPRALRMPPHWKPSVSRAAYDAALARIHEEIASGNTYQVNFTLRLSNAFNGHPAAHFVALVRAQPTRYAAFINGGSYHIASASPELFFHRRGETITMRPMKGTAAPGRNRDETERNRAALQASEKDRAENLMIVDMVRNDLGRIAKHRQRARAAALRGRALPHAVADDLHGGGGDRGAARSDLRRALSLRLHHRRAQGAHHADHRATSRPRRAASTPAPSASSRPDGKRNSTWPSARCTCARTSQAEYGIGGGIVWDSNAEAEYAECELKAAVLSAAFAEFQLLETMLVNAPPTRERRGVSPEAPVFLLHRHLDRLCASAEFFAFSYDKAAISARIAELTPAWTTPCILRLLLAADGTVTLETKPYPVCTPRVWQLALAAEPVDSTDPFLRHKTTRRAVYDSARAAHPTADDVLLWNERGELTESTLANLVIRMNGELITPPLSCGLLPGTYRAELLSRGRVREGIITIDALRQADAIFLINSVRGWLPARFVE